MAWTRRSSTTTAAWSKGELLLVPGKERGHREREKERENRRKRRAGGAHLLLLLGWRARETREDAGVPGAAGSGLHCSSSSGACSRTRSRGGWASGTEEVAAVVGGFLDRKDWWDGDRGETAGLWVAARRIWGDPKAEGECGGGGRDKLPRS